MDAWEFVAIREIIENELDKDVTKTAKIMNQIELFLICNNEKYKNFKEEIMEIIYKKLEKDYLERHS